VDTRSDVYSLGVMLYELLTGTTPFASDALKKVGPNEMRRIIREEEPPSPSQRVSTLAVQECSTVSEQRGVDGCRLGQVLRGELDWIVMKALEKDRDRRYESASAFAADVQRYLNDEAVEACPPSAGYRLRKYVRRNRRVLVPLVAIGAVLIVATAVSAWLAIKADAARKLADERLDNEKLALKEAATEAAIARAVNAFLQEDLLGQAASPPRSGQGIARVDFLTVKEALDRAAARIGQRFRDQPLVEAAIRTTIGRAYMSLSASQPAVPHLMRAFALRQAHLGLDHADTLNSMDLLASAYANVGRYGEAIDLRRRILEIKKAILGPENPEVLVYVSQLAGAYAVAGQTDKSVPLLEQLLENSRAIHGPAHPATLGAMHNLAIEYKAVGRVEESIALYENAREIRLSTTGSDDDVFFKLCFADACHQAGKLDQAESMLREALEHCRKQPNSNPHRHSTANTCGWLAKTLLLKKQYEAAEPLAREAVAFFEKEVPDNGRWFYWESLLGDVLLGQKRYAEAEPLLLHGYTGMKQMETVLHAYDKRRIAETEERVVRFYEVTNQPEKPANGGKN
jgi:tetratricopeptide (TPR) repeat protein